MSLATATVSRILKQMGGIAYLGWVKPFHRIYTIQILVNFAHFG